ncbi:MAG: hypothetical protein AAGJ10_19835 [Bacteroidota bacterium]
MQLLHRITYIRLVCLIAGFGLLAACDSTLDVPPYEECASTLGACYKDLAVPPDGVFTKSINRESTTAFEAELLARAEATYQPRDSVLVNLSAEERLELPESDYWYYTSFEDVRIPYAITGDAVSYYSDLIDVMNTGSDNSALRSAALEYQASSLFRPSYTIIGVDPITGERLANDTLDRVYVVEISLRWASGCGEDCSISIDRERLIVFDEQGNLLRVLFDGPVPPSAP